MNVPINRPYEWNCLRPGCKKFIMAYTQQGLHLLTEEHMYQHDREDRESRRNKAIEYTGPKKDYNILKMTLQDIGFLKTRGIKLDDQIEIDLSLDSKPTSDKLSPKIWAKILDTSINLANIRGPQ